MNMKQPLPLPEEPDATPVAPSDLEVFLQFANSAKAGRSTAAPLPIGWFDPDPAAITKLPAFKHPVTQVKSRRHGRRVSRRNFASQVRTCCARLQGIETQKLPAGAEMAFAWHHVDVQQARDFYAAMEARFENVGSRNSAIKPLRQIIFACARPA